MDWYLTDNVGTIHDVTDSTGVVVNHNDYETFGGVLAQSVPGMADRFLFTGRELESTLGLYCYRARYYSPINATFIGEDSLGFESGDFNVYRYAANQPLLYVDPYGLAILTENAILKKMKVFTARAAKCFGDLVADDLFDTAATSGVYILMTGLLEGNNVYVGKTTQTLVARWYQHEHGKNPKTILRKFPLGLSEKAYRNPVILAKIEQLLMDTFGGRVNLVNVREARRLGSGCP